MTDPRGPNWGAILGPFVALVGLLTYFTHFYRWPLTRDLPWVNYALLASAIALSLRGLRRAWPTGGVLRRAAALAGLSFSGAITAFFVWFALIHSARLPDARGGLPVGAPVPALALLDQTGTRVELSALGDPLVLVFYRGFWCSFCMSELLGLQQSQSELEETGARIAAISVDPVDTNRKVAEQMGLSFPILSDPDREALRAFDVVHPAAHPLDGRDMARPATFILSGGRVRWRNLTANYRIRPRPGALLEALRELRAAGAQ